MKVVLDTNVLVAAFAAQGLCHALLELCVDQHEIILSPDIMKEVVAALQKKLKVPPKVAKDVSEYLANHAALHKAGRLEKQVSRDPTDDHILALAEQSNADYIITGDEDLLTLKEHQGIPIVLPRRFWEILKNESDQPR